MNKEQLIKDQENFYNSILKIIDGLELIGNKVNYFFDKGNGYIIINFYDYVHVEREIKIPFDVRRVKFMWAYNYTRKKFENDFKKYMEKRK